MCLDPIDFAAIPLLTWLAGSLAVTFWGDTVALSADILTYCYVVVAQFFSPCMSIMYAPNCTWGTAEQQHIGNHKIIARPRTMNGTGDVAKI